MMRHTIFGAPPPPPSETPGRVTYPQLRVAASYDPTAFRAFWKINGMVCPPEQVYTDPRRRGVHAGNDRAPRQRTTDRPADP
jgi:hypothetical protein